MPFGVEEAGDDAAVGEMNDRVGHGLISLLAGVATGLLGNVDILCRVNPVNIRRKRRLNSVAVDRCHVRRKFTSSLCPGISSN
jgi:hypothetical protein